MGQLLYTIVTSETMATKPGVAYYINHFTKTTTWEDPTSRHRPFSSGQRPFVNIQTEHIPLQDMKPKMSPLSVKSSKVQDTSFTNATDTEEIVARISAMFPTVSETHIRILLKKYHGREALVVSVLQIEKHPITTPGPFATPPPQRNIHQPLSASPAGSPRVSEGYRASPRAHSSPKLKLRYMKSVFPQADETIILEVLQNNENNIQKTSDVLKDMGYERKDTVKVAQTKADARKEEQERQRQEENAERAETRPQPSPAIMKTAEEKRKMTANLQEKYKDVAEHLISIALESVNFDENRANQILQIMIQEDSVKNEQEKEIDVVDVPSTDSSLPVSQSRQSLKSLLKAEKEHEKFAFNRLIEENDEMDLNFRSMHLSNTAGPNPSNAKGANEKLLLENYVDWVGPNNSIRRGATGVAKGPNASLLSIRKYIPRGPNEELRKGPKLGLAKGSIFTQLKSTQAGDSRGK